MNKSLTIKELPEHLRPRERMLAEGPHKLSEAELLAIIFGIGQRGQSAVQLAQNLLAKAGGLRGLFDRSVEELQQESGIGLAKACQLKAVIELAIRTASSFEQQVSIKQPADVGRLLMPRFQMLKHEEFVALLLDTKNKVLSIEDISKGSLNASIVHPREVFKTAIRRSAAAIIVAHNHPSGDPSPSREDIDVTRRLTEAGKIIGIEVLDHIVFGDGKTVSMREKGLV